MDKLEIILVVAIIMLFGQEKVGTNGENFHAKRSMNYLIAYVHGDCTNFMYKFVKSLRMFKFNSNHFGYCKRFIELLIINNQTQWL